ncbi:flagellar M-ring protein FliF [Sphingobium subterraneum]|uniref:Flagellar M-ring protein n=2 Tax=Sphingobium subterraneum TaxID=627688 RepID=A0A841J0A2_9SPHN|nr:flagellar M-ring protein FliF [Sphingobium subterraneum]
MNDFSSTGSAAALPAVAGQTASRPSGFEMIKYRLAEALGQPAIARSLPMLGLLGVVGAAALMWMTLRTDPQRDLFRGLPDAEKAAVVEALEKSGVPYAFDRDTGSITVGENDYFKAKMTLASQGLPKSAPDGNSMIDSLPMGASRAVEGEKLRSAREMDMARTIEAIDAVESARVHLAIEPPSIFLRERSKPGASVMLRLAPGRSLSDAQVQAIVHLVASSVSDLSPEAISVVDQNGRLLSNPDGAQGEADRQLSVQARIEERYRQSVVALLTPILGSDKFSAEVHAEVNFAERQATRETYPQDEARLRVEQGSWQAGNPNGGPGVNEPGGIPGALSNQAPAPPTSSATNPNAAPAPGQQLAGGTASNGQGLPALAPLRTQESFNRSFELGREISVTRDAVGTVKRVSVAVALDNGPGGKPRTPQEIAALEALVKGAVGYDQTRGDTVALSSRSFVKVEDAAAAPWYEAAWLSSVGRNLSALAVVAILIFGIGRPLLKRRAEGGASGASSAASAAELAAKRQRLGREMSAELARTAMANPGQTVTLDMISSTPDYAQRADLIRNFVKQDPDRAALVVRDLLKENSKSKEAA